MNAIIDNFPTILAGFWMTIRLTLISAAIALVLGTILAAMRVSPLPVLRGVGAAYVGLFVNTPLTLVLLFCSLGLNVNLGVQFSDNVAVNGFWLGILGLSAYTAAFVCETLRSGINTVALGQAEAARSIGLTFTQTLTVVVLPQAFRAVIAPMGSQFIALAKNTTVVTVVGVAADSYGVLRSITESTTSNVLVIFIGFALGFIILTLPTGLLFGWWAKRAAVAR
ncbi:MAG TPA: amino acid ABC transporter permease [Streptosporangiaceae bacterium]